MADPQEPQNPEQEAPEGVPQDPQSQAPGTAQPPAQGSHVHPPRPNTAKPGTGQGVQPGQVIEKSMPGFGGGSEGRSNISEDSSNDD